MKHLDKELLIVIFVLFALSLWQIVDCEKELKYTSSMFNVIFSAARCGVLINEAWLEGEMLVLSEKLAEEKVIFSRSIEANLDCDIFKQGTKTKE